MLTAGTDGVARVWDSATGRQLSILRGHTGPLSGATMSSDGQRVLTASFDHTAAVWDAASGDELLVLRGHLREVTSAQFSADGRHALTTSLDGAARIWQVTSGQDWLELAGHSGKVYTAAFSPDGHQIASGGRDNTVRLWTGSASAERPQASAVTSVAYSPDGQRLVVALQDGSAHISSLGARVAPDVDFAGHSSADLYRGVQSRRGARGDRERGRFGADVDRGQRTAGARIARPRWRRHQCDVRQELVSASPPRAVMGPCGSGIRGRVEPTRCCKLLLAGCIA